MTSSDPIYLIKASELRQVIRQEVAEAMAKTLAKQVSAPPAALRITKAAAYIGHKRSKFYSLLKKDRQLAEASFRVGNIRLWRREDLDAWLRRRSQADLVGSASDSSLDEAA
jgi:predicted DNA-binding transcriptional regulator AlpA